MRHAKSSWKEPVLSDHERPLAPRGRKQARRMALELARMLPLPSLVLCSSASRALQTYQALAKHLGPAVEVHVEDRLYGADAETLLARLRAVPAKTEAVLLIAHNPGVEELLRALCLGGELESTTPPRAFYTGALAIFRISGDWSALGAASASLQQFLVPST